MGTVGNECRACTPGKRTLRSPVRDSDSSAQVTGTAAGRARDGTPVRRLGASHRRCRCGRPCRRQLHQPLNPAPPPPTSSPRLPASSATGRSSRRAGHGQPAKGPPRAPAHDAVPRRGEQRVVDVLQRDGPAAGAVAARLGRGCLVRAWGPLDRGGIGCAGLICSDRLSCRCLRGCGVEHSRWRGGWQWRPYWLGARCDFETIFNRWSWLEQISAQLNILCIRDGMLRVAGLCGILIDTVRIRVVSVGLILRLFRL